MTTPNQQPDGSASSATSRPHLAGEEFVARLDSLISDAGGDTTSYNSRFIRDLLTTSLKLLPDERDTGELKLMASSMKELRHAYRVFAGYPHARKISIFGSARTPADHPDYIAAVEFSKLMTDHAWLSITGAGDGIMKAGHEGPGRESSFGLSIRLPFETTANEIIAGDSKLINFRYFFTRKLMFVSQSDAVAAFPGGFGTQDELFEVLTLIQTGKSTPLPIILVEGAGGTYWKHWENYVEKSLLEGGFISKEDLALFYIAKNPQDAVDHVIQFYKNYHSSRYVRDDMVIRLKHPLNPAGVEALNDEFSSIVKSGKIVQRGALEEERDHLELPRIVFTHTRRAFGVIRSLIDRINEIDPIQDPA